MTRVLLVDDHAVVRRGVRDILTEALGKVAFGEAANPGERLEKLQEEAWDVVGAGHFAARARRGRRAAGHETATSNGRSLVLSMHAEEHYALRAAARGGVRLCEQSRVPPMGWRARCRNGTTWAHTCQLRGWPETLAKSLKHRLVTGRV